MPRGLVEVEVAVVGVVETDEVGVGERTDDVDCAGSAEDVVVAVGVEVVVGVVGVVVSGVDDVEAGAAVG